MLTSVTRRMRRNESIMGVYRNLKETSLFQLALKYTPWSLKKALRRLRDRTVVVHQAQSAPIVSLSCAPGALTYWQQQLTQTQT